MVDLAEFEAESRTWPQHCKVARLLEDLTVDDKELFTAALAASHITDVAIAKRFRVRGLNIADKTIHLHRNDGCCCVRA